MKRRLKGWGWAAVGALIVFALVWFAATVITALKQRTDEQRITRIERVVIGLNAHRPAKGGGAQQTPTQAHQQPSPPASGGGQGSTTSPVTPERPASGAPQESPTSIPTPAAPVVESVTQTVEGVTETACTVNALGVTACP